jgi:predicted DNA-binding protein YlxM (UPF0122 family)
MPKKKLSQMIDEKFGSISSFVRATGVTDNVYYTIQSVEESDGKATFKIRSAYNKLEELCESTAVPDESGELITNDQRKKISDFFTREGAVSVKEFATQKQISKALIYAVIKGDYKFLTKKVVKLFGAIDEDLQRETR